MVDCRVVILACSISQGQRPEVTPAGAVRPPVKSLDPARAEGPTQLRSLCRTFGAKSISAIPTGGLGHRQGLYRAFGPFILKPRKAPPGNTHPNTPHIRQTLRIGCDPRFDPPSGYRKWNDRNQEQDEHQSNCFRDLNHRTLCWPQTLPSASDRFASRRACRRLHCRTIHFQPDVLSGRTRGGKSKLPTPTVSKHDANYQSNQPTPGVHRTSGRIPGLSDFQFRCEEETQIENQIEDGPVGR